MKDVLLKVTKAMPAANANHNSATLDLGPSGGAHAGTAPQLLLELPATPALVDAKSITLTVQDSLDDSTYATVEGYGNLKVTGAGGAGAAAKTWKLKLHDHVRRYVQINIAVENAGGDNTAKSLTASIVYP